MYSGLSSQSNPRYLGGKYFIKWPLIEKKTASQFRDNGNYVSGRERERVDREEQKER